MFTFLAGQQAEAPVSVRRPARRARRVAASTLAGCLAALSVTAAAQASGGGEPQADIYGKRITNSRSGLRADVMWASQDAFAGVFLWSTNSSLSQKFDLLASGNGYFRIRAEHSGQCLMLNWQQGNTNGTQIIQYPNCGAGYHPAEWRVGWVGDPVQCSGDVCSTDNLSFPVLINRATGRCLDAANPSGNPRQQAPLQQWDCIRYNTDWNAGNQEFTIGDSFYAY
jgi:hypothetical protein